MPGTSINIQTAIDAAIELGYPEDYLSGKIIAFNLRGKGRDIYTPTWQVFSDEESAIVWQCASPDTRHIFYV